MTMQEYLTKNSFNSEIVIKFHCHGVRLDIHENWSTVVSVVEPNIDLAWTEALKALPKGRAYQAQKDIEKYQEYIKDKQEDINHYKQKIANLKKKIPKPRRKKANS